MIASGAPNHGRAWALMPLAGMLLAPTRIYAAEQRTFADFAPTDGFGGVMTGVPVLSMGGGPTRFAHFALERAGLADGREIPQLLVLFIGTDRRPFGCLALEEAGLLAAATPERTVGGARAADFQVDETAIGNGGSRFILGAAGDVTTDTRGATGDPTIRWQLPAGGHAVLSRDGAAAGRLAMAAPVKSYATDVTAKLDNLIARIQALELAAGIRTTLDPTEHAPAIGAIKAAVLRISADVEA